MSITFFQDHKASVDFYQLLQSDIEVIKDRSSCQFEWGSHSKNIKNKFIQYDRLHTYEIFNFLSNCNLNISRIMLYNMHPGKRKGFIDLYVDDVKASVELYIPLTPGTIDVTYFSANDDKSNIEKNSLRPLPFIIDRSLKGMFVNHSDNDFSFLQILLDSRATYSYVRERIDSIILAAGSNSHHLPLVPDPKS
jgi:hypothetical protein